MSKQKKILIAVLDWGLGHATRCMPIIDYLLIQHHQVTLSGCGDSLNLLKEAYPHLQYIDLPAYNIRYAANSNAALQALLQTPKIIKAISKENALIEKLYSEYNWDYIISDNRYGIRHVEAKNIFICHQIALRAPKWFGWSNFLFLKFHLQLIQKFNELWIPDVKGKNNLSGKLAHDISFSIPHNYIGVLSRFINKKKHSSYIDDIEFEILVVLSGPEPLRSSTERILKKELQKQKKKVLLIQGKTAARTQKKENHITTISYLNANEMLAAYSSADVLICHSGYSTIMDLSVLNKKAIYIPTKGQTEQEYLAHVMQERKLGVIYHPGKDDLNDCIHQLHTMREIKQHAEYMHSFTTFISQYHF